MMQIKTIVVGILQVNCYIVSSLSKAIIIDPGADAKEIAYVIESKNLEPILIINTHYHFDHTGGNADLKNIYNIPIAIGLNDAAFLENSYRDGLAFMINTKASPKADILLKENDKINFGEEELVIMETPGHSIGSICLVNHTEKIIFSGDTLFFESIGRFDLPNSSEKMIYSSLKKLTQLEDCYRVYPGHGPSTTLGHERLYNLFLSS